ncbi:InlB B-repeat-containing protein [Paludibaculum fermentans]|uniref:InlB B-repeat-containing protein n=1 Tax=Paludibaculum fermentans TaxID=1473598 RepID=UPI003EB822D8
MYLIRVTNVGGGTTAGTISVVESMPSGIAITSMSGPGWTCQANQCTRTDSFPAGAMLPTITVLSAVDANAPASVANVVTVSGGGDSNATDNQATDVTTIAAEGWLMGWGSPYSIAYGPPGNLSDVVAVSISNDHGIALRKDGTVVEWMQSTDITSAIALSLNNVIGVAAGNDVSYALKRDGTVTAWSRYATVPPTAQMTNVVAISALSDFALALRADGTMVAAGASPYGETNLPAGLSNIVQFSMNAGAAFGLSAQGGITAWGNNAPPTPPGLGKLVKVASIGLRTAVGIQPDGTVVGWDDLHAGGLFTLSHSMTNVTDVTGTTYILTLKGDGSVEGLGSPEYNLVPFSATLTNVRAISANQIYAVAILTLQPVVLTIRANVYGIGPPAYYLPGPQLTLDGYQYVAPYSLTVSRGSSHSLSTPVTQPQGDLTYRYTFANWSDGGAIGHAVTVNGDSTYTANFAVEYKLATSSAGGGTVVPATAMYAHGTAVLVRAVPDAGYAFSHFSSPVSTNANNPVRVVMDQPVDLTGYFSPLSGKALRISLKPQRNVVQGQQNAVYAGRIWNEGSTAVSGVQVRFEGLTPNHLYGAGWTCSQASCSRTDTLQPGQAYPAILIIASVSASASGTAVPMLTITPNGPSATAPSPISGAGNRVVGWGDNTFGQSVPPQGLSNLVGVAAGSRHSAALKGDGTIAAWGNNTKSQTQIPAGLTGVISISAGANHTLALTSSGGVVAWGDSGSGQSSVPANLSNVIAVAAGANHSLALTSSGTVIAWGANGSGQATVPASVQGAIGIAAGGDHSLAVLRDGTVVAWGSNTDGESSVPVNLARVESVFAGAHFSVALRDDGTVAVWGNNPAAILSGMPAELTNVRDLATGASHALAVQWDGTVLAWGSNGSGQTTIPPGLAAVTGIAGGSAHSLAIAEATAQMSTTISTTPAGATYMVDGVTYSSNQILNWTYGSSHTISAAATQPGSSPGTQLVFQSWDDGIRGTTRTFAATGAQNIGLVFKLQNLVTVTATTGGSATPATGYVDDGSPITIAATAAQGFGFSGFNGDLVGRQSPRTFIVRQPVNIVANFSQLQAKAMLAVDVRRASILLRGQTNAAYRVRVGNMVPGGATSGAVQLTATPPTGLTITSMNGPGWNCNGISCTRSDTLASGQYFPVLTVIAKVENLAPSTVAVQFTASGGSDPTGVTVTDSAAVNATATPVTWNVSPAINPTLPFPAGLSDVVAVSASSEHFLALRKNGTVAAWGGNQHHECEVPAGLSNVIEISAGGAYSIAVKADGTIAIWGEGLPVTGVPSGLSNIAGVASGRAAVIAIQSDGSLITWGDPYYLDLMELGRARNVVAVSAGNGAVALTIDGAAITISQANTDATPAGTPKLSAVSTFGNTFAGIAEDGKLVAWGSGGSLTLPSDWVDLAAISLGFPCSLAQKKDGSVTQWGCTFAPGTMQPTDLQGAVSVSARGTQLAVLTTTPPATTVEVQATDGTVKVDGIEYPSPRSFAWTFGSAHTIEAAAVVPGTQGSRARFAAWSDGGAPSHTYLATGTQPTVLLASYLHQSFLTTNATLGGTITPASGWYDNNLPILITATPSSGYFFSGFAGALVGTVPARYLYLQTPNTVTAMFTPVDPQPGAVSVTPSTGSGNSAGFTAIYSDGFGYSDLSWIQFLVAAAPDGGGQPYCFLHYDVQGDGFWLYGNGGFFVGPVKPGTPSAQLQNSLCAANTKTSTVSGSGALLTLKANLVFKAAAGLSIYMRAHRQLDLDTGWIQRGTWSTAPVPLGTMSVQPATGSGSQQTFVLAYPDPAGFEDTTAGWSQFLVAAATDGGGQPFCFVHYDKAGNGLWMYSGDVGFFVGPVSPGTASNALDSSACSVNTGLATVTHPTGVVNVSVPVTMKPPMAGVRNLYQRTLDPLSRDSGWVKTGIWTVP